MTNKSVHNKENENALKFYFKTNVKYTVLVIHVGFK